MCMVMGDGIDDILLENNKKTNKKTKTESNTARSY